MLPQAYSSCFIQKLQPIPLSDRKGAKRPDCRSKSMRNNISWLEPDLRQPKDRLALLARVVGRLITTVDQARLDHVLFDLPGSSLRLDAFHSYERTNDRGLKLIARSVGVRGRKECVSTCEFRGYH